MRSTAENAQLALLLEVSSTPKPGNVDREREYPDLRFEHFVTGAVGAREGLDLAADGRPVGAAFETAIEGMSLQSGGNTQFGAILLLMPLVGAAAADDLTPEGVTALVEDTTVADAAGFYRAFDHVDVAVDDPPADMDDLDVRRGSDAVSTLEDRGLTLADVMERSADVDSLAAEWTSGFPRTFEAADRIASGDGPVTDRAATVYIEMLAAAVDTFVVTQHDRETAEAVRDRAQGVLDGEESVETFAADLVARQINPGTTADLVAGGLFVALERGLEV
ncbi:triphosphoribosyl-dephospho-CoA synthase [Halobacteriales archaeon Cl-PHB]